MKETVSSLGFAGMRGNLVRPQRSDRAVAILALLVLTASAFVPLVVVPSPTRAQSATSATPLFSDDFTHDTSLNPSLWQINGSVGSAFGPDELGMGITLVTLEPTFSSAGMEIAQINASEEVGTIQSIENFIPPFTAIATVEGTVSNGHTFGFAIASANASSGIVVYGNLNPTNCSHLGDCSDPSVCGTSANSAIPPNQCYYGIDGKVGQGGGSWGSKSKLYPTPSVNVTYTLQISVDASGNTQYSVSQGGQVLGTSNAQIGTGPFYIILEQGEGAPVAHPGPNVAYWKGVSISPLTTPIPGPSSGIPTVVLLIIIIVVVVLFLIILLWYRRRNLTVTVQDSQKLSPVPEAGVSADGPEKLSGYTAKEGKITFKGVKKGDYLIKVSATGYNPPIPVKVTVKKTIEYIARLDRIAPVTQEGVAGTAPSPGLQTPQPQTEVVQPTQQAPAAPQPAQAIPQPAPAMPRPESELEQEGFGGGRINEIIKTFQAKGAISPETALTAQELGLSRLFVRIMKRRQGRTRIFMEINGRYYLNKKALEETK
jgi:hypothetical protein